MLRQEELLGQGETGRPGQDPESRKWGDLTQVCSLLANRSSSKGQLAYANGVRQTKLPHCLTSTEFTQLSVQVARGELTYARA